jgi:LCP family protein required for cell wall assembly
LALAVIALGIQSWRVVSAIVDAEQAAVVPLPTRETEVAFTIGNETTVTPTATVTLAPSPTPQPTASQTEDTNAADRQTPARPTEAQAVLSPSATRVNITPSPTPTARPPAKSESPSRLDVVRRIVEASMADGDPAHSAVWQGKTDLYVLVIGVDRRPDGGDQNADVIILAHLDLVHRRLAAVSIPRDLLVEIPGVGPDKINSSYNYGHQAKPDDPVAGVVKVRDTVEHVFRVPIDHYVLVDFNGFKTVVDALGGIEVDVPYLIHDDQYPTEDYGTEVVEFAPGRQHMDGDRALKYVRTRHADSDDARRERQLDVLLAIFDKGKSFRSVTRADEIILAVGDAVQTSFQLEEQLTLARLAREFERDDIKLTTLGEPLLQGGFIEDGRWVYTGDLDAIRAFIEQALDTEASAGG